MADFETISNDNFFTVVVDPNGLNKENVRHEDLFIFVDFRALPKSRSVIEVDGTITNEVFNPQGISFISSDDQGASGKFLTTNWTNIGGGSPKEEEAFGIDSINIEFGRDLTPIVNITFTDVRGGGLMNGYELMDEQGVLSNNSQFAAFFTMPYPVFQLTVKGFYGKAVSYCLHLLDWKMRLDAGRGDFVIDAKFQGYTFAFLADVLASHVMALTTSDIGLQALKKEGIISISELITRLGKITSISEEFKKNNVAFTELKFINSLIFELDKIIDVIGNPVNEKSPSVFGEFLRISQLKQNVDQTFIRDVGVFSEQQNSILSAVIEDLGKFVNQYNDFIKEEISKYSYANEYKINNFNLSIPANSTKINDNAVNKINEFIDSESNVINLGALRSRLSLPENSEKKFYIINFSNFRKEIIDLKNKLGIKKKKVEEVVNEELNKNIESQTGLKLTVKSVFEILLGNVDVFLKLVHDVSLAADNKDIQEFRKRAISSLKNDLNGSVERVYPFPAVYNPNTDEDVWLGDIVGEDNPYFPEIGLVKKLLNSAVTSNGTSAKDKITENAKDTNESGDSWVPLFTEDYKNTPYKDINSLKFNGNEIPNVLAEEIIQRATYAFNRTGYRESAFNNIAQLDAAFAAFKTDEKVIRSILLNVNNDSFADEVLTKGLNANVVTSDNTTVTKTVETISGETVTTTITKTVERVYSFPEHYIEFIAKFEKTYGYPFFGLTSSDPNGVYGTSYSGNKLPSNLTLSSAVDIYKNAYYSSILENTPEGLKPILLDIAINQFDPLGILLFTASRIGANNVFYTINDIRDRWFGEGLYVGNAQKDIPYPSQYENTYSYIQYQNHINDIQALYDKNPKLFMDELSKSRIMYYSRVPNREKVNRNKITLFNEWSLRVIAVNQFAKDVYDKKYNEFDYYYNQNSVFFNNATKFSLEVDNSINSQNTIQWYNSIGNSISKYLKNVTSDENNVIQTVTNDYQGKEIYIGKENFSTYEYTTIKEIADFNNVNYNDYIKENRGDGLEILNIKSQKKRELVKEVRTVLDESKLTLEEIIIPKKFKKLHRNIDKNTYLVRGDLSDVIWTDEVKNNIKRFYKSKNSSDLLSETQVPYVISSVINDLTVFDGQKNNSLDFIKVQSAEQKYTNLAGDKIGLGLLTGIDTNKILFEQPYYLSSSNLEKAYLFLCTIPLSKISDLYEAFKLGGIYDITKIQLAWIGAQFWRAKYKKDFNTDIFENIRASFEASNGSNPNYNLALTALEAKTIQKGYLPDLDLFSSSLISKFIKYFENWVNLEYISNFKILDFNPNDLSIETAFYNYRRLFNEGAQYKPHVNNDAFYDQYGLCVEILTKPTTITINDINAIKLELNKSDVLQNSVLRQYLLQWIVTYKKFAEEKNKNTSVRNDDSDEKFYVVDKDMKIAAYRYLKNLYDKWLGGSLDGKPYNSCSGFGVDKLLERFHFVDTAFNPVGDRAMVDPKALQLLSNSKNENFVTFLSSLGKASGFDIFALPGFVNYKSVSEAKDMWKPTTNLENVNSGSYYICMYNRGFSKTLDLGKKSYYANDGFDFRETEINNIPEAFKKRVPLGLDSVPYDKDKYNLVVFRVGYADQNQSIFKNIEVSQQEHKNTAEYLQAISDTFDTKGGTKPYYKKANLYNIFSLRSYKCSVKSMGNMMLNPLNYFQLDNIPFFHGAYMISKVKHSITPHNIETDFEGYRMPRYLYPVIDSISSYIAIPLNDTLFTDEEKNKKIIRPLQQANHSEGDVKEAKLKTQSSWNINPLDPFLNIPGTTFIPPNFDGQLILNSELQIYQNNPLEGFNYRTTLDRNAKWAKVQGSSKVTITDSEIADIMNKLRNSNLSASYIPLAIRQTVTNDKLNSLDNYLNQYNIPKYVVGKGRVARIGSYGSTTKKNTDEVYGFIDYNRMINDTTSAAVEYQKEHIKYFKLPYPLYNYLNKPVEYIPLHKKVGDSFIYALEEVLDFYGLDYINKLALNQTAGGFVFRANRNQSSAPSPHAYGIAVDFAADLNQNAWNFKDSLFSNDVYRPFLDILEKWGWYNLGRYGNFDAMHFQAATYGVNKPLF